MIFVTHVTNKIPAISKQGKVNTDSDTGKMAFNFLINLRTQIRFIGNRFIRSIAFFDSKQIRNWSWRENCALKSLHVTTVSLCRRFVCWPTYVLFTRFPEKVMKVTRRSYSCVTPTFSSYWCHMTPSTGWNTVYRRRPRCVFMTSAEVILRRARFTIKVCQQPTDKSN